MKNKKVLIHYVIEILLAFICIFIGKFEDAFVMGAVMVTTVYNVLYVILLRRKTGEKLLESIANIILVWALVINVLLLGYMIWIFVFGYYDTGWFGTHGETYYGLKAWVNNLLVIFLSPILVINFIYMGIYGFVKRRKKNKITL